MALKKRLIFTLLFNSSHGSFVLSRNFRLQSVGDINWIFNNYDIRKITRYIDELVLLDVSRDSHNRTLFADVLSQLSSHCHIPVCAGGGIHTPEIANQLFKAGADKLCFNSAIYNNLDLVQ